MKLELQEKIDHTGKIYYWIYKDGSAEIPIYSDKGEAERAYNQLYEFYTNPPEPKIIRSEIINGC